MRKAHGPKSNIFPIAAAFVVFVPYVVHGTQKGALDEQKWLGACKLAGEFKKVQNRLVFRLSAPSATAQGYMCQLLWTKIIVEKQQKGSHSKKDIALINYYAEQAQKALAQAQGAPTTKLASALRNSAAAEAAIQEFINMLGQISDGDTHSCLEKTDSSNDLREHSTEFSADAPGCKISTKDLSGSDEQTDHLTRTGANTGLQTPKGSATTSATLRCEFSQGKTSTNKLLDSGSGVTITGTPKFAAGLFVMTGNDIEHTSTADLTTAATTAPLLHAAHAAYLLSQQTAPAFKFKNTEKLAVDTDFQHEFIKTVLNQKDSAPPVEDIAGKIKKAYDQKEDMKRQYNDIFATTEVKNSAGDEPETKNLNSITKIDDLTRLLYFNQQENIKDLRNKIKKLGSSGGGNPNGAGEKICTDITDVTECNNKPYCSYNASTPETDKKCKFNETKATENGVPVTQTQTLGEETASDRCTKHTEKEDCEAENKNVKSGEKSVCGLIEGKCQDSSYPTSIRSWI